MFERLFAGEGTVLVLRAHRAAAAASHILVMSLYVFQLSRRTAVTSRSSNDSNISYSGEVAVSSIETFVHVDFVGVTLPCENF